MADIAEILDAWAARSRPEEQQWRAVRPGPSLEAVIRRIASVPRLFLDDRVQVSALAVDVLTDAHLTALRFADDERVRRGASIGVWLVASETLLEPLAPPLAASTVSLAVDALALRVAPFADPMWWLSDAERAEEAARSFLLWAGLLPAGEDARTARALLDARDSLRRNEEMATALADQRRRLEIARRLADARAKEAAARYSHE